jgi:type IV pilus assembly protein PilX
MNKNPAILSVPRLQRGVSLIIVLILLLIMTLLGLAVLRSTLLEERMSANLYDRSLSFQAVEGALREAEALVALNRPEPADASACVDGVCPRPDPTQVDRWLDPDFAGWVDATDDMGDRTAVPSYFIEYMGTAPTWPGCDRKVPIDALCLSPRYRVTARSQADARASVILQTNFIVQ